MVRRPKAGTLSGNLWAYFDSCRFATKEAAFAEFPNANRSTVSTQFSRWRAFNSVATEKSEPTLASVPDYVGDIERPEGSNALMIFSSSLDEWMLVDYRTKGDLDAAAATCKSQGIPFIWD